MQYTNITLKGIPFSNIRSNILVNHYVPTNIGVAMRPSPVKIIRKGRDCFGLYSKNSIVFNYKNNLQGINNKELLTYIDASIIKNYKENFSYLGLFRYRL